MRLTILKYAVAAFFGVLLATPIDGAAQGSDDGSGRTIQVSSSYNVQEAQGPMTVDGRLDETAWQQAEVIPLPIEIDPGDNVEASVRTECRITYDQANFYLGCEAFDPHPDRIRAFLTDRDQIFGNNDRISLLIDPFNDSRRGWVFEVSPLGVQADLVYDERTDEFDATWDAIWESAGRITEDGYVIEAAIPFASLRFPTGVDPRPWRFWINRMRPRSEAYRIMRTNTRIRGEACQLCQAPTLEGIHGVEPGRNVELTPTLVASRADVAAADGSIEAGPIDAQPGLDARWSITTDLSLNATANPDFSQVEADAPQLDANTRFALFFPEKRPFFLEGADLFGTPLRAVFTRSVADPIGGLKLTGKLGRNGLGLLATRDEQNNLILPGPRSSASVPAAGEVSGVMARYRRDLGGRHTLGALYTGRMGTTSYMNQVAGVDAFLQPTSATTVNLQLLASATEYDPDVVADFGQPTGTFTGLAFAGEAGYNAQDWGINGTVNILDDGFRADAGFITQVDQQNVGMGVQRRFYGEAGDPLTFVEFDLGGWNTETMDGELIDRGASLNLYYEGAYQIEGWLNPNLIQERFSDRTFDIFRNFYGFFIRPVGSIRVGASGRFGTAIDFRNTRKVNELRVEPTAEFQIGRAGELSLSQQWQRLSLGGEPVLTAQAGQLRSVYNFSTRAFVRAILQYRRTERDPATNPGLNTAVEEGLFTSLLFSYKLNPLTVLFLGYSDDRSGFEDVAGPRVDLRPQGRTFFLKVGYAWRP